MWRTLRRLGGAFIRRKLRAQRERFLAATIDCRRVQAATLERILALNAESQWARSRFLSPRLSPAAFQQAVPLGDYESFRSEVDRLRQGETSALLGPQNRLLMFALSSGTTAASKFIPITSQFLDDYRRGWSIWGITAFDAHPTMHGLDIFQLGSDFDQFRTPAGTPCGNISGLVGAMQSPIVRSMYVIPPVVCKIKDARAKYYAALRVGVMNPYVGMVMTANPSTLIQLARMGEQHRETLLRDIHDGTLSSEFDYPAPIRQTLERRLRANPRRARELDQRAADAPGIYPRHCWPRLALVAVWTGGSAGAYLETMRPYYGNVPVRDHGLSASEGRMTIPIADESPAGLLDIDSHYFEFVPEAERESTQPIVLMADELEVGQNYFIVLTTPSGLWRYDISDVVRCVGHRGTTPLLEFLHKGAHIASLTGEKLSESQVVMAMRSISQRLHLSLGLFTLAPVWGDPPRYRLHLERELAGARAAIVVDALDRQLAEVNLEYQEKRATGRLAAPEVALLPTGTWRRFMDHRQGRLGGSVEQYKHPALTPDLRFSETLLRDFADQSGERAELISASAARAA